MDQPWLLVLAVAAVAAMAVWARSARYRQRQLRRTEAGGGDPDLVALVRSDLRKDTLATAMWGLVAVTAVVMSFRAATDATVVLLVLIVPAVISVVLGRNFVAEARVAQARAELERRAQEVLDQEELAPRRWAARLAPEDLPDVSGFEIGRVYQAGSGLMAGDFYDLVRLSPTRLAAVIGDVSGHGIEPAITAFQAKYLLRVFLRQYRDPAQALEELNAQMAAVGGPEEFISLCVVVFDTAAGTIRHASAGHPAAWLWHGREVRPLRATGPVLMMDPTAEYTSRERTLDSGDLCLLYTDGLSEVRDGGQMFGEDRVAAAVRRDPGVSADVLCKSLLEAASDFSSGPLPDDIAILAIRRD
jgi:sigma-B regulation protein RsbU (phosphoserine phosphatase)